MHDMSDETKELLAKYIGLHGIPIILCFSHMLQKLGLEVSVKAEGSSIWDAAIKIERENPNGDDISSEFHFYNTFLEVLCVDRDDDPMVFDPKILDDGESIEYISEKIQTILEGRLIIIRGLLDGKSAEDVYNENPDRFERISYKVIVAGTCEMLTGNIHRIVNNL